MKKIKAIAYILLIVIVVVMALTIYTNASKETEESQKDKVFSEIKYVEEKVVNLLNSMNNIQSRNYNMITSELSKETTLEEVQVHRGRQAHQVGIKILYLKTSLSGSNESKTEQKDKKKFELKENGVLTNKEDINWDIVKSEIETLYTSIPTITIDLYQLNINKDDILGFNSEFDNLTKTVKEENKENTLSELVKVYEYLPKFLTDQDELYRILVETKLNIFKGYAKLDKGKWSDITNDIDASVDVYSKLLTNNNVYPKKQYNISKIYIMLNELKNAVQIKDESVFLIKYKNLLEEINNM